MKSLLALMLAGIFCVCSCIIIHRKFKFTEAYTMSKVYDYSVFTPKGEEVSLSNFKGKVLIIVNTATGCGFTPQYEQLEGMYERYHDKGLEVIDIPCNQFGNQAPGSDEEIHEFCALHFNTAYDQFRKSDVNGEKELPLYTFLKSQKGFEGFDKNHKLTGILDDMLGKADPDYAKKPDIKWNFTKFIVNRDGEVVKRFEPTADMAEVEAFVKSLL
jgi:glutathione peroxidase